MTYTTINEDLSQPGESVTLASLRAYYVAKGRVDLASDLYAEGTSIYLADDEEPILIASSNAAVVAAEMKRIASAKAAEARLDALTAAVDRASS